MPYRNIVEAVIAFTARAQSLSEIKFSLESHRRTAKVFTDDRPKKKEWLTSEDGKQYLDSLTEVLWLIRHGKGKREELGRLIKQFFVELQDNTNKMVTEISRDQRYSDLIENNSFDHIKSLLEIAPPIITLMDNPELLDRIRKELP